MPESDSTAELIRMIERQQDELVFTRFDNDDAWRLGSLLVAMARDRALGVTVDIRRNGQLLFHHALPGSCADQDGWIELKSAVVTRWAAPSYLVGLRFAARGRSFDADSRVDPRLYAAHGGSFPITIRHVGVVGAITVSGLPQADDHDLVVEAIRGFVGEFPS